MKKNKKTETSILFIIFNRPEITKRSFKEIKKVKPKNLFIVADGPRNKKEKELCKKTRRVVEKAVDWECKIHKIYSDKNLGCFRRISSGITEAFEYTDQLIILEDDCVADSSFFSFCKLMLEKYSDDKRVMSISGHNFIFDEVKLKSSYYFSIYNHSGAWGTWKRAWNHFEPKMHLWPLFKKEDWISTIFNNPFRKFYWTKIFDKVYRGEIDSWAYRWTFACWTQNALHVIPSKNLVKNIGFGDSATHTKERGIHYFLKRNKAQFPIKEPKFFIQNKKLDSITEKNLYKFPTPLKIIKNYKEILASKLRGGD